MFETDSCHWLEQFHNFNQIPLGFKLARGEEGTEALVRSEEAQGKSSDGATTPAYRNAVKPTTFKGGI